MTAEIIDLDDYLVQNLKTIHNSQVKAAIDSIKKNLNNSSIELLIPFIVDAALSPEFLCRVRNDWLWALQDALDTEATYRRAEARA